MLQNANNYDVTFCFPEVPYAIDTVVETTVEPLWECHEQHFVGLFRIVARLTFSEQPIEVAQKGDVILIDALDVEGQQGYFEYAVPFEGKGDLEKIVVPHVQASIEKEHRLQLSWRVNYDMKQQEVELQEQVADVRQQSAELQEVADVRQQGTELQEPVVDARQQVVEYEEPAVELQQGVEEIEATSIQVTAPKPKKQSNIFMNDLVEQFSIWRSSDLGPQKKSDNNK